MFSVVLLAAVLWPALQPALVHAGMTLRCEYVDDSATTPGNDAPNETETDAPQFPQLSEVYPAPVAGQEEFIELYNPSTAHIDLAGHTLTDASGKVFRFATDGTAVLAPRTYTAFGFAATKIYLNNDGDSLVLKNAAGEVLDEVEYTNALSGLSWSRVSMASNTSSQWDWTSIVTRDQANILLNTTTAQEAPDEGPAESNNNASPSNNAGNDENSTDQPPTTLQTSGAVVLNEMLPNPVGSDTNNEWIELVNGGTSPVSLEGWVLTDGATRYTIRNTVITSSGGLSLFPSSQTRIALNNTNETIQLIDPFGTVVSTVTYGAAGEGMAWAKISGQYTWTTTPTPGAANILTGGKATGGDAEKKTTAKSPLQKNTAASGAKSRAPMSITESKNQDAGAEVTVRGVVTSLPGQLTAQTIAIQDDDAGIQIYSYNKDFPAVSLGSRVTVSGEITESRDVKRIKISQASDMAVAGGAETDVLPLAVTEITDAHEGLLVQTDSTIADKQGTAWELENGIILNVKKQAEVQSKEFKKGAAIHAQGIIERATNGDLRIVPRMANDIALSSKNTEGADAAGATSHDASESKSANDAEAQHVIAKTRAHVAQVTSQNKKLLLLVVTGIMCALIIGLAYSKDRILHWLQHSAHPLAQRARAWFPFVERTPAMHTSATQESRTNPTTATPLLGAHFPAFAQPGAQPRNAAELQQPEHYFDSILSTTQQHKKKA